MNEKSSEYEKKRKEAFSKKPEEESEAPPEQKVIEEFREEMDDKQIRGELQGKVIQEYAYQFKSGSKVITGLSYSGVMAAARKQGDIKVVSVDIQEDAEKVIATATGRDEKNNVEIKGIATQPKNYRSGAPDDFAIVKATAKAQRNVIRRLINEPVAKAILVMALDKIKKDKEDAKAFM